jgi:hypothetical protein
MTFAGSFPMKARKIHWPVVGAAERAVRVSVPDVAAEVCEPDVELM